MNNIGLRLWLYVLPVTLILSACSILWVTAPQGVWQRSLVGLFAVSASSFLILRARKLERERTSSDLLNRRALATFLPFLGMVFALGFLVHWQLTKMLGFPAILACLAGFPGSSLTLGRRQDDDTD